MTSKAWIASLYEDISVRHGLTARLRLEAVRANFALDYAEPAPVASTLPSLACATAHPGARRAEVA